MFEEFFRVNYEERDEPAALFGELVAAISRVVNLVEYKDTNHSQRVAVMSLRLARAAGVDSADDLTQVYSAGLLHDIGEVGIPDTLLYKKGRLSEKEYQLLSTHTRIGQQIVEQVPLLKDAASIILWHHERWDGRGYPEGLVAEETPLLAQVVSLCDALDSIRRGGLFSSPSEWRKELESFAGIQFNPYLVPHAVAAVEQGHFGDLELTEEERGLITAVDKEEEVYDQFKENYIPMLVNFLTTLMEAKHKESAAHSRRVGRLARKLGERMGLSALELDTLEIAGYLHDSGKMGIPNSILGKREPLDEWEVEIAKKHPEYSASIISPLSGFGTVAEAVLHHHENYDGTGYPDGLAGEEIPLLSRILMLADTADALAHVLKVFPKTAGGEGKLIAVSDEQSGYFDPQFWSYAEAVGLRLPEQGGGN
ncbi:MAG: hypothetical protein B1H03_06715 [Planctomycetales bacterium 4484_113]|nr:MAG: hypothetical protein B1H03_06715 [Planctomycetales bacterium 4484_113]